MLLATRCPHCETVFRLQQEQLALHGGLVRCGHCRQVFDASASLVDEHASQPEPAVAEAAARGDEVVAGPADAASTAESAAVDVHAAGEPAVEAHDADRSAVEAPGAEAPAAEVPAAEVPAAEVPAAEAPAAEAPAAEAPAAKAPAAEAPAAEVPIAELPAAEAAHREDQHAASPPRLFVENPHAGQPAHADFRPDHWDMWAPWLDGNVDPALQHSVRSVNAEPLVPVALPNSGVTSGAEPGVVRLTGTPQQPSPVSPATTNASASDALPPISPAHGDEPAASAFAAFVDTHDAREPHLAADLPPASPDEARAAADPVPQAADTFDRAPLSAPRDAHEPRFVADIHHASASATSADDDRAVDRTAHEPRFAADASREPFTASPTDDDRPHFAVTRETRAPARRGLLGGFLGGLVAAALAALLVVQLAWWQRESLMIYWPVTQGWFRQLCAPLGCTVAPPRAIDGLRLDATDLRQIDGPRVLELKAPLTNRYRVALAYPSLELTLLDDTNHVTARRVLAPRDYVRPGTPIEAGLPAGATQTMIVRLETNGTPASNFRVQIFYP
ncbi:DUF3426 domain-containing protein [Burkholderia sp. MR1-5-21]